MKEHLRYLSEIEIGFASLQKINSQTTFNEF